MDNTNVTIYHLISQAGWKRCNLSIYLSCGQKCEVFTSGFFHDLRLSCTGTRTGRQPMCSGWCSSNHGCAHPAQHSHLMWRTPYCSETLQPVAVPETVPLAKFPAYFQMDGSGLVLPQPYVHLMIHNANYYTNGPPVNYLNDRPLHLSLRWPFFPGSIHVTNELANGPGLRCQGGGCMCCCLYCDRKR